MAPDLGDGMCDGLVMPIEQYLRTSFHPDCDFEDGKVRERYVGELDHSRTLTLLAVRLHRNERSLGIRVGISQRILVRPDRCRVADICVLLGETDEQVFTRPPFLCIEILSPEDRLTRVGERTDDYLAMGVRYVWLLDPRTRRAYIVTPATGLLEIKDGVLRTENPNLEVPLNEIFE